MTIIGTEATYRKFGMLASFFIMASFLLIFGSANVYAASTDIGINEIMYNPASGIDDDEYLELRNNSATAIDISGWCFSQGITLVTNNPNPACFEAGTLVPANGYFLLSPNPAQTLSTYGISANASYAGSKLSNGGETITLVDQSNNIVDTITYDDISPWPTSPDGGGNSLELVDPVSDNGLASSWMASLSANGTPAQQNSVFGIDPPVITNVTQVPTSLTTDTPVVTAKVTNANTINLVYKVMFGADQTLPMYDDGSHGDGTAGDGVYGATIPAQASGSLVRYKVSASNPSASVSLPGANDSINYYGYLVDDGDSDQLPIIRWYMDDADFNDMVTNHAADDMLFSAVFSIDGKVYDNAKVRVKGQSSTSYPKKKFKFELPSGYTLGSPYFNNPIDEFSIQIYFLNFSNLQEKLSWNAFEYFGFPELQNQYVRVLKNNGSNNTEFYGHYLLLEDYDKTWRERNGFEDGILYKEAQKKKTRTDEGDQELNDFIYNLNNLQGQELKDYLLDNVDVPGLINYTAVSEVISSNDWSFYHNVYQYNDYTGTKRWSYLPWDLDNAFVPYILDGLPELNYDDYLNPVWEESDPTGFYDSSILTNALFSFPEFREMYEERASTVYEQVFGDGDLALAWLNQEYGPSKKTMDDDFVKWNPDHVALINSFYPTGLPFIAPDDFPLGSFDQSNYSDSFNSDNVFTLYNYGIARLQNLVDLKIASGDFRTKAPVDQEIVINEVMYNSQIGDNGDYIELYNPNSRSVDVSSWTLSGSVNAVMSQGSVIPAGGYGLVVKKDVDFRNQYQGSQLVLTEYSGSLGDFSGTLSLARASGLQVFSFDYGSSYPWPSLSSMAGYSIELVNSTSNRSSAYCWAPTSSVNGTTGIVNNPDEAWVKNNYYKCEPRTGGNKKLAATGDNQWLLLAEQFGFLLVMVYISIFLSRDLSKQAFSKKRVAR